MTSEIKPLEELLDFAARAIVLSEYLDSDKWTQNAFRNIFSPENPTREIEDIVFGLSAMKADHAVNWMHDQRYYNSDEYLNNRYDP